LLPGRCCYVAPLFAVTLLITTRIYVGCYVHGSRSLVTFTVTHVYVLRCRCLVVCGSHTLLLLRLPHVCLHCRIRLRLFAVTRCVYCSLRLVTLLYVYRWLRYGWFYRLVTVLRYGFLRLVVGLHALLFTLLRWFAFYTFRLLLWFYVVVGLRCVARTLLRCTRTLPRFVVYVWLRYVYTHTRLVTRYVWLCCWFRCCLFHRWLYVCSVWFIAVVTRLHGWLHVTHGFTLTLPFTFTFTLLFVVVVYARLRLLVYTFGFTFSFLLRLLAFVAVCLLRFVTYVGCGCTLLDLRLRSHVGYVVDLHVVVTHLVVVGCCYVVTLVVVVTYLCCCCCLTRFVLLYTFWLLRLVHTFVTYVRFGYTVYCLRCWLVRFYVTFTLPLPRCSPFALYPRLFVTLRFVYLHHVCRLPHVVVYVTRFWVLGLVPTFALHVWFTFGCGYFVRLRYVCYGYGFWLRFFTFVGGYVDLFGLLLFTLRYIALLLLRLRCCVAPFTVAVPTFTRYVVRCYIWLFTRWLLLVVVTVWVTFVTLFFVFVDFTLVVVCCCLYTLHLFGLRCYVVPVVGLLLFTTRVLRCFVTFSRLLLVVGCYVCSRLRCTVSFV